MQTYLYHTEYSAEVLARALLEQMTHSDEHRKYCTCDIRALQQQRQIWSDINN